MLLWAAALLRGDLHWRPSVLLAPIGLYILASLGAVAFSQDPRASLGELGELLTLLIVPLVCTLLDRRRWDVLLKGLALVATLSSSVGIWQYLHGASNLGSRLRGLSNHYMTFSGWTLVVCLLLIGDIGFNRDRRRLLWSVPACTICCAALLLSYTRNAWVGLGAGLVLVAVVWQPKAVFLYLALAALLAAALPPDVIERALSIVDLRQPSNYDRLCMSVSGIEMIQDHPVFGVGLGMVERRYPLYRMDDAPRWRVPHLHSNPLQIGAERGLLGLAAYVAVLATFFVTTWRALRSSSRDAFPVLAGCFLAVAGVSVAGLFEYNWGDAEVWILTLVTLASPCLPEVR